MRIAHVNDIAFVGSTLAREMRRQGHEADLIEPPRVGASIAYPWKAVTFPIRLAGLAATAFRLRRAGYDVVHVHYARLGILGPLSGQPYVLHCHGTDVRGLALGTPWARIVEPALRRAAAVYYATPDLAKDVLPIRPGATFLPNPIDTRLFTPDEAGPMPSRDVLVGVRLDHTKGADAITKTIQALLRIRPVTTLTVVAQGSGFRAFRSAMGDDTHVEVVEPMPQRELPALFRRHRLTLGQLRVGAIGNFELEAIATGLPVVANFQYPEAYDEPPPIVPAGLPEETARRMGELLDDEGARLALAALGPAWIARHHAADMIAARLIDDYRRLGLAAGRR